MNVSQQLVHAPPGHAAPFAVHPLIALPPVQRYGAALPQDSCAHSSALHAGHPGVGGAGGAGGGGGGGGFGPGGAGGGATIAAHHGIATPPRTSFVQSSAGTNGCRVFASSAIQLPQKP